MKVQIALLVTLIAFAFALPVPDEDVSPIQSAVSDVSSEKKINTIEDTMKTSTIEEKGEEAKPADTIEPALEGKSVPEIVIEEAKEAVFFQEDKEETPAERKLDVIVPTVEDVQIVPAVGPVAVVEPKQVASEEKSEVKPQPEERASDKEVPAPEEKSEKKEEEVPVAEAISETKEIREEKPAETKIEETKPEENQETKKAEELKSDDRQIRGDDKKDEPAETKIEEIKPEQKATDEEPKQELGNAILREVPIVQVAEPAEKPKERAGEALESTESKESVEKSEKPRDDSSEESEEKSE